MIQETRDIRILLAHRHDQPTAIPDFLGRLPANPSDIAAVINRSRSSEPSHRELRRKEKSERGR